jgi:hypothetical protein
MGIFDFLTGRNKAARDKELSDIRLAMGRIVKEGEKNAALKEIVGERRMTLPKPLMYSSPTKHATTSNDGKQYQGPVHDLTEIALAMDVEPYVNQSVRKHREQILKEGYSIVGEDDEMVEYVNRRLFEISLISGISTNEFVREFSYNLAAYATSLLVLKRDKNKSSGRRIKWHGKILDPIAAIYPLDPTSVSVNLNKYGHATQWKQVVENSASNERERTYSANDVIVATIDKKAGFVFGTPYILPVLDDVRALRRLEELAETSARKYAYPSSHWKVGTDEFPAQEYDDGTTEIELLQLQVQNITPEGGMVTSHRIEQEVINESAAVFDVEKYIKYYEQRVLGGLRLSPVDIGRGDVSKASAGAVSQSLQDSSRDFQAIIQDRLTNDLVIPLLLEGGFDIKHDNIVRFEFPMINREEERAKQSHGADLFNTSVITRTEFRQEYLAKKELDEDQIKDIKLDMDHQRAKELQEMGAAASLEQSKASKAASNTIGNKNRPKNQNGQKEAKTMITANNSMSQERALHKDTVSKQLSKHKELIEYDDLVVTANNFFDNFQSICIVDSKINIVSAINEGIKDALSYSEKDSYNIPKKSVDRFFKNYIGKSIKSLTDGSLRYITNSSKMKENPVVGINAVFDQLEDDLGFLCDKQIDIAYRFGFSKALRSSGYSDFKLSPVEGKSCSKCSLEGDLDISLETKDMPYHVLLATHDNCSFVPYLSEE